MIYIKMTLYYAYPSLRKISTQSTVMGSRTNKDLKLILHPYVFVLKEGHKINEDFLDYSLLILQVGRPETLKSPKEVIALSEFDLLKHEAVSELV